MLHNPTAPSVCPQSVIILAVCSSCYQPLGNNVPEMRAPSVKVRKYPLFHIVLSCVLKLSKMFSMKIHKSAQSNGAFRADACRYFQDKEVGERDEVQGE